MEAQYKFRGGKQHIGADLLIKGGDKDGACERDFELMTVRTEYPYQHLTVYRAHSNVPGVLLWSVYVPTDAQQRTNKSVGLLMVRKPKISGLIHLAWPVIRYFAQSVLAQDRMAVEAEQEAYDVQACDLNREISPVLLELCRLLSHRGVPISVQTQPASAQQGDCAETNELSVSNAPSRV